MMSTPHSFKNINLEKDRGREKYMKDTFIGKQRLLPEVSVLSESKKKYMKDIYILYMLIWNIETHQNVYNASFVIIQSYDVDLKVGTQPELK